MQMSSLGAESLEGSAGAKACGWKAHGVWLVTQRKEVCVGAKEEVNLGAGGREKVQGRERAPEHVLCFLGCPGQPRVPA